MVSIVIIEDVIGIKSRKHRLGASQAPSELTVVNTTFQPHPHPPTRNTPRLGWLADFWS